MSKYVLIFKSNQPFDWTTLPQEEAQKAMSAWGGWIASMGEAVQASDAFKFGGKSVVKAGSRVADNLLTGFVVVEADDFAAAEKLATGAPSVAAEQGSIEVYEVLPTHS